jgi:hypothetical protein
MCNITAGEHGGHSPHLWVGVCMTLGAAMGGAVQWSWLQGAARWSWLQGAAQWSWLQGAGYHLITSPIPKLSHI